MLVVRLANGVFRPSAGQASSQSPADAPIRAEVPRATRVGLVGSWSQKFSLVHGRLTRFDGGYTHFK